MDQHNELISQRIEELTKNKEVSINRIATLGGVNASSVSSIFYGTSKNPTIKTIKAVCDGLDVSVKDFFDFPPYNQRRSESSESIESMKNDINKLSSQLEELQKRFAKKIDQ